MTERKSRRVVRLSRVDQERLERGEFASALDAVHQWDAAGARTTSSNLPDSGRTTGQRQTNRHSGQRQLSQRDREILGERPPHFGKL